MQPFALLALLDAAERQDQPHANAARWFAVNAVEGGSSAPDVAHRQRVGLRHHAADSLLPAAGSRPRPRPPTRARPSRPRSSTRRRAESWRTATGAPNGTMFDYRASWDSINHQLGDGGQFELYRKGEWLTKEMSNYDNNDSGPDHRVPQYAGAAKLVRQRHAEPQLVRNGRMDQRQPVDARPERRRSRRPSPAPGRATSTRRAT